MGNFHGCAVVDGGVQCWGLNHVGQLGNGTSDLILYAQGDIPSAVETIPSGSNVTTVSAGAAHTCALINGGVRCWGANDAGQLGDGTTTNRVLPIKALSEQRRVTTTLRCRDGRTTHVRTCTAAEPALMKIYGAIGRVTTSTLNLLVWV